MLLFTQQKMLVIPENIILLPIPPYCPELNPAQKVGQWMKDKIAMKIYDNLEVLETKIEQLLKQLEKQEIKSITRYEFYLNIYNTVFKV